MTIPFRWLCCLTILVTGGCRQASLSDVPPIPVAPSNTEVTRSEKMSEEKIVKSEADWRAELTPEQYHILREKGTERAFTGKYWNHKEDGSYVCAGCGQELFRSDTKFDSGCGWPSFWDAVDRSRIEYQDDFSYGMHRIEVMCKRCGGHLGHVFPDGPKPTGQRYCINSASLDFRKAKERAESGK